MLDIESLFGSDRTKPACRQIYGISGTGKTVFLCESIRKAARSRAFSGKHRFIIFDVKADGYQTLAPPVFDSDTAIEKMANDRVVWCILTSSMLLDILMKSSIIYSRLLDMIRNLVPL